MLLVSFLVATTDQTLYRQMYRPNNCNSGKAENMSKGGGMQISCSMQAQAISAWGNHHRLFDPSCPGKLGRIPSWNTTLWITVSLVATYSNIFGEGHIEQLSYRIQLTTEEGELPDFLCIQLHINTVLSHSFTAQLR